MNTSSIAGEVLWKSDDYGCVRFGFSKESRRNTFTCDFISFFECEAYDSRHWHDCTEVAVEDAQFIKCVPTLTFAPKNSEDGYKKFELRLEAVRESSEEGSTVTRFLRDNAAYPSVSTCQKFGLEWNQHVR